MLALARHGAIAGTVSSLMGALQLATGSVMVALSGVIANGTSSAWSLPSPDAVIAALAQLVFGARRARAATAAG